MINQSSLSTPFSNGAMTDSRTGNSSKITQAQSSFRAYLDEDVIDVYERKNDHIAVADERKGVERRQSVNRRKTVTESIPTQSGQQITETYLYSTNRKVDQTYTAIKNIQPAVSSLSSLKGTIVDTWA